MSMMASHLSEDGADQEPTMPSADEIQSMMVAKAHELFAVCDKEEKVRSTSIQLRKYGFLPTMMIPSHK